MSKESTEKPQPMLDQLLVRRELRDLLANGDLVGKPIAQDDLLARLGEAIARCVIPTEQEVALKAAEASLRTLEIANGKCDPADQAMLSFDRWSSVIERLPEWAYRAQDIINAGASRAPATSIVDDDEDPNIYQFPSFT